MLHTVTITYNRPLVRRALNRYFAKRLGKPFFVVLCLLCVYLAYSFFSDSWDPALTYITIPVAFIVVFLAFVYVVRLRAAEGFFDKADDPTVTITFSENGVSTESDLGTSVLNWAVFEEILKFPDVWLLVYAKSGYMTLPLAQLPPDCRRFIDDNIPLGKNSVRT